MALRDGDIAPLTLLLSAERLASLTTLTGSPRAAIELHQDTLRLSATLMTAIATVEIALRNAVSDNLAGHFGVINWLFEPPAPFKWKQTEADKIRLALDSARRSEYAKLSQSEKGNLDSLAYPDGRPAKTPHLSRAKKRRQELTVTTGKVIAELTLYFWKRLYGPDYEQSLWRTTLKRTFPNKRFKRSDIAPYLEVIYQSRNRLAHHEPILHRRFDDTVASIRFVCENLGEREQTSDTPLLRLLETDLNAVVESARDLHSRLSSYRIGPSS